MPFQTALIPLRNVLADLYPSEDGTAKVLDAENGEELLSLLGHANWVNSAAYNAAGDRIVTASRDRTARTWFSDIDAMLDAAASLNQRYAPQFTAEERQHYGLEQPLSWLFASGVPSAFCISPPCLK